MKAVKDDGNGKRRAIKNRENVYFPTESKNFRVPL